MGPWAAREPVIVLAPQERASLVAVSRLARAKTHDGKAENGVEPSRSEGRATRASV